MNRGQPGVASRDTILPRRFKVIQKEKDIASPKVVEFEIDDATVVVRGKEAEQQHVCVPITQHRSGTEAACERQMLCEECAEGHRELSRGRRCHRPPFVTTLGQSHGAEWAWNRSLAASAVALRKIR
jgi:hypothetical protein